MQSQAIDGGRQKQAIPVVTTDIPGRNKFRGQMRLLEYTCTAGWLMLSEHVGIKTLKALKYVYTNIEANLKSSEMS